MELLEQYKRLYKTFHVSLLELYMRRAGEELPGPVSLDEDDRYQVESIRKERVLKKQDLISNQIGWLS